MTNESQGLVVEVNDADDIVMAREAGHQLGSEIGFPLTDVTINATVIPEIARNITSHAGRGGVRIGGAGRRKPLGSADWKWVIANGLPGEHTRVTVRAAPLRGPA
jgi:hypothetical protein